MYFGTFMFCCDFPTHVTPGVRLLRINVTLGVRLLQKYCDTGGTSTLNHGVRPFGIDL